jgi:hypothetical protein
LCLFGLQGVGPRVSRIYESDIMVREVNSPTGVLRNACKLKLELQIAEHFKNPHQS